MLDLRRIIERISYNLDILEGFKRSLDEFKEKKRHYHLSLLKSNVELLVKQVKEGVSVPKEIISLTASLDANHPGRMRKLIDEIANFIAISIPEEEEPLVPVSKLKLPSEIRSDILADVKEIEKCFEAGCFRSVAILCGRLLEIALHRRYYEETGIDLLEKSPGIGLGKLIAKLSEKQVELDPGLSQQIHLINQVRIFSVHVKQSAFNPNHNQAHAMILYTFDILEKMYS
jgi:hypothetical protein